MMNFLHMNFFFWQCDKEYFLKCSILTICCWFWPIFFSHNNCNSMVLEISHNYMMHSNMIYWSWPFLLCHDLKGKGGIKAGAVTLIGEFNLCKHNVYPGQSDWTHAYHNTLNFVKMLSFYLLLFLRILIQGMQTLIINRGDPTSSLHLVSPRSGI